MKLLLDSVLTEDLKEILHVFGHSVNKELDNIEKQEFIWEMIINIKKNMLNEINQTIRNNLIFCFMMEEKEQIKNINNLLYRFNHILELDIYRFDNKSNEALYKFHQLVVNTYGSINNFCKQLRYIIENIYFYRKNYDEFLIEKYNYFKKISLPLKGYQEMRIALITLLKKFNHLSTIVNNAKLRNKLFNDIESYHEKYKLIYITEHNKYHLKLRKFYYNINSLPEYEALEKLSRIKTISFEYDIKPIKKYFNNFFPDRCYENNLDKTLQKNVCCSCGFNLGHTFKIPSLNKIKPLLKKGLVEYLQQIKKPKYRYLFTNYINYNPDCILKKIINFNKDELIKNLHLINNQLIKEINAALSSFYYLNISINEIADMFYGIYPISQLDILAKHFNNVLKNIIENKIAEMENIDYDNILINLIK